jgi:isoquinoline 1-oxidoreductase alpha subunit
LEANVITLRVNGTERSVDVDPDMPLLWVLRDTLGLTGTKFGCGMAQCGACTVHINGEAARSCITAISDVSGKSITTIEGLSANGLHPVQKAWMELNVPQCGYCQSGQIMQAAAMLDKKQSGGHGASGKISDQDIDTEMSGNICRCGCFQRIRAAVKSASEQRA